MLFKCFGFERVGIEGKLDVIKFGYGVVFVEGIVFLDVEYYII